MHSPVYRDLDVRYDTQEQFDEWDDFSDDFFENEESLRGRKRRKTDNMNKTGKLEIRNGKISGQSKTAIGKGSARPRPDNNGPVQSSQEDAEDDVVSDDSLTFAGVTWTHHKVDSDVDLLRPVIRHGTMEKIALLKDWRDRFKEELRKASEAQGLQFSDKGIDKESEEGENGDLGDLDEEVLLQLPEDVQEEILATLNRLEERDKMPGMEDKEAPKDVGNPTRSDAKSSFQKDPGNPTRLEPIPKDDGAKALSSRPRSQLPIDSYHKEKQGPAKEATHINGSASSKKRRRSTSMEPQTENSREDGHATGPARVKRHNKASRETNAGISKATSNLPVARRKRKLSDSMASEISHSSAMHTGVKEPPRDLPDLVHSDTIGDAAQPHSGRSRPTVELRRSKRTKS
ncbi:hypothetical protein MMC25_001592 [Agyrium rufum]|nr:hypothetical protein [Agyrium rufum]